MSPVDLIVSRLDRCIPSGKNRYIACCPAHADKSPSLSIAEAQDGRALIHCHAGCSALDIVESLGLELADLYPPDMPDYNINQPPVIRRKKASATVDEWILELAQESRRKGQKLSQQDLHRERQAFMRVHGGGR